MPTDTDPNFANQIADLISEFGMSFLVGMLVIIAIGIVISMIERPGKSKKNRHHGGGSGVG